MPQPNAPATPGRPSWARSLFRTKRIDAILADASAQHADAERRGGILNRNLTVWDLTAMGIAAIVGAGIFSTIGQASADGGPAVTLLFVFTAVACGLSAMCYAEFAARLPIAGSAYTYAYATFGELVAWIIGWDLIMEYAIGNVVVAISWSDYFQALMVGWGIDWPAWLGLDARTAHRLAQEAQQLLASGRQLVDLAPTLREAHLAWTTAPRLAGLPLIVDLPALAIVALLTAVVYVGVRESKRVGNGMVVLKLLIVVGVIVVGAFFIDLDNWSPFAPNGFGGVMKGASAVFFAYIGFDSITTTAEESRHPTRDLPRAIIASLIVCTILYILIAAVLTGMVPYQQLAVGDPIAYVFTQVGLAPGVQQWVVGAIALSAVVAMAGVLLVFQLGQPRIWMAMGRDGLLPARFGRIHPRYQTPAFATVITGLVVGLPLFFMSLEEVTDLTSIGTLFAFVLVCGGVMRMRWTDTTYRPRFAAVAWAPPRLRLGGRVVLTGYVVLGVAFAVWALGWPSWWGYVTQQVTAHAADGQPHWYGYLPHALVPLTLLGLAWQSLYRPVPLMPALGMLSCLYLMAEVPTESWVRFVGWLLVGLLLYAAYGYRHSRLRGRAAA